MRQYIILLVVISCLVSCRTGSKINEEIKDPINDTSQYTIIRLDTTYLLPYGVGRKNLPADLSVEDIALIKEMVDQAINNYNQGLGNKAYSISPLNEYKMQIIASRNEKEEKIVWVNCFCGKEWGRYKKEILIVDDGGSCYFNLTVNLSLKKAYDISVNGEA